MEKRILQTNLAPAAIGPYSQGVGVEHIVFVSGQLPIIPETGELCKGTVADMTLQAMNNVLEILGCDGMGAENIVKTTILLTDINDFADVNAVYGQFFPDDAPARACFQVAALPKGARLEIEAIAMG